MFNDSINMDISRYITKIFNNKKVGFEVFEPTKLSKLMPFLVEDYDSIYPGLVPVIFGPPWISSMGNRRLEMSAVHLT